MSALDFVIIALYLAGVIVTGMGFARRQRSTERFFLGDQRIPWWAVAASIVATETSTISLVSVPGIAYSRGGNFTFLQLVLGYLAGRILIAWLFIPQYFAGKLNTVYQLLHERFGRSVTALAASLFITVRTIADGVRLLLTAIVLGFVIRSIAPSADLGIAIGGSIIALGLLMIVFSVLGGIEAIVWIEVVQLLIYGGGTIAAAAVLLDTIPGGLSEALAVGSQFDKFRMFDFSFDVTRSYVFWSGLIGGAFLTMSTHGTDQYMVQRYLSTSGRRSAAAGLLVSGAVVFLQFVGFLFIGVLLFAHYRPYQSAQYAAGLASAPFVAADQVFPHFITHEMPSGLSGLMIAAILAAAMSSSLNAIASTAVADLYRPIAGAVSDLRALRVSRIVTIVAGVAQIGVALALREETRSALDSALSIASLINGPILGCFLFGMLGGRTAVAALSGMTAGLAVVVTIWLATPIAWPWYTVIGSLTTVAVGWIVGRRVAGAVL